MSNDILATALRFATQGIVAVPVASDGSKRPGLSSWKEFQERQPTQDELLAWFHNENVQGLGVVTGPVSGNLLMIEFEGRAIEQKLHLRAKEAMKAAGLEYLWEMLANGYSEMTPSGGIHFLVKIEGEPIAGNTKLASKAGEDGGCLIETRGSGGFCITAPTGGTVHPTGQPWTMISGSIETIPTIATDEMNELFTILQTFDEMPKPEITKQEIAKREFNPALPGDDYNARMTWEEILEPIGWKKVFTQAEKHYGADQTKVKAFRHQLITVDMTHFMFSAHLPHLRPTSHIQSLPFMLTSITVTISNRQHKPCDSLALAIAMQP
jgi:hypothetical protein